MTLLDEFSAAIARLPAERWDTVYVDPGTWQHIRAENNIFSNDPQLLGHQTLYNIPIMVLEGLPADTVVLACGRKMEQIAIVKNLRVET